MNKVHTISGNKVHLSQDNVKTLCGRDAANAGTGDDVCKRCADKATKLADHRSRAEYAARVAESQDDVMSQTAPTTERSPMDVKVTTRDGERITYAHIPNGDPARVEHFRSLAERSGAFTNITAEPTFPATSNVAVGDGPNGERTLFADSVATVNEWITSGRFHKHSKQQVPTLASICPCDRYKPSEAPNLTPATPDTTTPVKAPEKPAWRVVDTNTGQEVTLPTERVDFRGDVATIKGIAEPPSPGKSGKLYYDRVGQTVYPQVFDLKIVPALDKPIMHYGQSRIICGADPEYVGADHCQGGEGACPNECECGCDSGSYTCTCENSTTDLAKVTCGPCREAVNRQADLPATMTALAGNGHMMTYNVTGRDADGRLTYTQWDAWHADTCPCNGDGTFDDSF